MEAWSNQQTVETIIQQVRALVDKRQRNFLVLRTSSSDSSILVFPNEVKEELWPELVAGRKYNLTVKENEQGNWKLVDFNQVFSFG